MKWAGKIGFLKTVQTDFDVMEPVVEEKSYTGDVIRNNRRWETSSGINDNFVISNALSVVADDYMLTNFQYMRYVTWQGAKWKIKSIDDISYPRLTLQLGDIYNGPSPSNQ